MAIFTAKDVFEFAVKIEVNGEYFYRETAKKLKNPAVQQLFVFLADEEVKHKKIFQEMTQRLGSLQPTASSADFEAYLEAYTQNLIFSAANIKSKVAEINDEKIALLFAIDKELDSVHYYKEIKAIIPESERGLIDGIIAEEQSHVLRLAKIKKTLS
jgi:rubrerythrin